MKRSISNHIEIFTPTFEEILEIQELAFKEFDDYKDVIKFASWFTSKGIRHRFFQKLDSDQMVKIKERLMRGHTFKYVTATYSYVTLCDRVDMHHTALQRDNAKILSLLKDYSEFDDACKVTGATGLVFVNEKLFFSKI